MTRLASSVESVRLLARSPGTYWYRIPPPPPGVPHNPVAFAWEVAELVKRRDGVRVWRQLEEEACASDAHFVGCEIVGPIPEPPDDD